MNGIRGSEKSGQVLLTTLEAPHPEWRSILAVIEAALLEVQRRVWMEYVPAVAPSGVDGEPLLSGAVLQVPRRLIERWVSRVLAIATGTGARAKPLVQAVAVGRLEPSSLFEAAVSQDSERLDDLARSGRDDRGVLRGLAPIIAMPVLQACRSAWADRVSPAWTSGYCPICGSRPALAEFRRLNGRRHLRCGRCGGDWRAEPLRCPFCGERDHEHLGSLVSPETLEREQIEICDGCGTYIKTITTLAPIRRDHVVLQDLATVLLDVAAAGHGYQRPEPRKRRVAVSVVARPSRLQDLLRFRR